MGFLVGGEEEAIAADNICTKENITKNVDCILKFLGWQFNLRLAARKLRQNYTSSKYTVYLFLIKWNGFSA